MQTEEGFHISVCIYLTRIKSANVVWHWKYGISNSSVKEVLNLSFFYIMEDSSPLSVSSNNNLCLVPEKQRVRDTFFYPCEYAHVSSANKEALTNV